MAALRSAAWRLGLFLTVCAVGAFVLLSVFAQLRFGPSKTYGAEFLNVSGLRDGDIVRIAGVEVGKVQSITVNRDSTVRVEFSADDTVVLTEGSRAEIRYDDLIGDVPELDRLLQRGADRARFLCHKVRRGGRHLRTRLRQPVREGDWISPLNCLRNQCATGGRTTDQKAPQRRGSGLPSPHIQKPPQHGGNQ